MAEKVTSLSGGHSQPMIEKSIFPEMVDEVESCIRELLPEFGQIRVANRRGARRQSLGMRNTKHRLVHGCGFGDHSLLSAGNLAQMGMAACQTCHQSRIRTRTSQQGRYFSHHTL